MKREGGRQAALRLQQMLFQGAGRATDKKTWNSVSPKNRGTSSFEFLQLLCSAGALGLERDIHGRGAGLRTHLLVSAGAALFIVA
jgi:hypothetical protein